VSRLKKKLSIVWDIPEPESVGKIALARQDIKRYNTFYLYPRFFAHWRVLPRENLSENERCLVVAWLWWRYYAVVKLTQKPGWFSRLRNI
jgi:hypothetical protein